jgi:hypothetical protein
LYGPHRKPAAGFFLWLDASERLLQFVETVASTCQQFVYELETIGTSARQLLSRPVVPLRAMSGMAHLTCRRNNFVNNEIALDTSGKSVVQGHHRKKYRKPARSHPRRAFCLTFTDRAAAANHGASSPLHPARRKRAAVRASQPNNVGGNG